jgi:K+-sensing histidine kinase KdpD
MGATKAAIFVLNHAEHRYRPIGSFGFSQDTSIIRDGWATSDDLPQMLHLNQERISSKDLMNAQSIQGEQGPIEPFDDLGLDWYYPLLENGRLLGFLAFGSSSSKFMDGVGEETFWNAIVQESVMVLENSIMREEIRRFQGLLCQMDRLRSVETMATGLTHELDNPVRSIKAFVQVAQMRRHDGEFMEQLHRIVGKDLGSIEALIKEIREYVKPLSASPTKPVYVHDVIDSCLLFIASNPAYHNIMIEKKFSARAPMVLADRQAIMQAFFNGLLFLLKDAADIAKTIEIETKTDIHMMGLEWVQVILRWKSSLPITDTQLASLENLELEGSWSDAHDSSIEQGVILAQQIIQRHSGDLQILTTQGAVIGFHFQLPAHLSEDLVGPLGSLSVSSHSVKPGQSHSSTETRFS